MTVDRIPVSNAGEFENGKSTGKPNYVVGKLTSPTNLTGTYTIQVCQGAGSNVTVVFNLKDKAWAADWQGPAAP